VFRLSNRIDQVRGSNAATDIKSRGASGCLATHSCPKPVSSR
jgi:hypothetical protein